MSLNTTPIEVPKQYGLTDNVVDELHRLLTNEKNRCEEILIDFSLGLRTFNYSDAAEKTLAIIDEALDQLNIQE